MFLRRIVSSILRSTLELSVDMSPEIKSGRLSNSLAPILGQNDITNNTKK